MKLTEILNQLLVESKQVGILYHYTNISSIVKILETGILRDSNEFHRGYVSFSRNGSGITGRGSNFARIVIDGDKLSNIYSIVPDSQARFNKTELGPIKPPERKQQEERIYKREVNILNSIIQIDIIKEYANDELTKEERSFIESKVKLNLINKFLPYK